MSSNLKYHLYTFTLIQQHIFTLLNLRKSFSFFLCTEDIAIMKGEISRVHEKETIIMIDHLKNFDHYDLMI